MRFVLRAYWGRLTQKSEIFTFFHRMQFARPTCVLSLFFFLSGCISQTVKKEDILKEDLYTIRNAIDQYTEQKAKAPQTLEDLVKAGYLRSIPVDPFTNSNQTWQIVQEDILTSTVETARGITDVHSGFHQVSSDHRTFYSDW